MGEHSKRRSTIDTDLPESVRKEMRRMLIEGDTYDDVAVWLKEQGYEISRSAVGRWGKTFFDLVQNVRQVEEQSSTLIGDEGNGMILEEATTKLLMNKLLTLLMTDSVDLKKSTKILTDVANIQKSVVSREKLKIEIRDRAKDAAVKVENISKKAGLSQDVINRIKKEILGIGQ